MWRSSTDSQSEYRHGVVVRGGDRGGLLDLESGETSHVLLKHVYDHDYLKLTLHAKPITWEAALQAPTLSRLRDDGDDEMDIEEDEDADMDIDADEEDEDDEMDVEIDEEAEEEHSAPAYPVVVALPATVPSAEETEPFED
ncbi:hypothetical protein Tco_1134179 [Tanacetum coccineum]